MSDLPSIPMDVPSISPSLLRKVLHVYWERIIEGSTIREMLNKSAIDLTLIIGSSIEDAQRFTSIKYWLGCLNDTPMDLRTEPKRIGPVELKGFRDWTFRSKDSLFRFIKLHPEENIRWMSWEERNSLGPLSYWLVKDREISAFRVKETPEVPATIIPSVPKPSTPVPAEEPSKQIKTIQSGKPEGETEEGEDWEVLQLEGEDEQDPSDWTLVD